MHTNFDEVENDDEDVGYRKPPRKHCFPKGKSGNPKGRPKRDKILSKLGEGLHDALTQKITVTEGDKILKLTRRELMVRQLVNGALAGEKRALVKLLKLRERVEVQKEEGVQVVLDAGDLAAIGEDWQEDARNLRKQQKAWEAQRRKQGASFRELIDAQLARKITVTVRGKPRRMATLEAISIQFVNLAAKGDNSIIDMLLKLAKAPEATVKRPSVLVDHRLVLD